jgi:hypothetical protein
MKDKKSIIDTYSTIYYVDIVVANKYVTLEELKELYTYCDGNELDEAITSTECTTSKCIRKVDNKNVLLVKYNYESCIKSLDKHVEFINTVAHEAGHCVLDIYDHMQQSVCNCSPEPFCYLLGYIAECIYKTLKK